MNSRLVAGPKPLREGAIVEAKRIAPPTHGIGGLEFYVLLVVFLYMVGAADPYI